jgi:hypothetical protein
MVLKRVESAQAAEHERFLGSPTVRVNGQDVDGNRRGSTDYGLRCRLYPSDRRRLSLDVPDDLIRAALSRTNP